MWVSNLEKSGLMSLKELYSLIEEWHSGSASFYTFDAGGMEVTSSLLMKLWSL